MKNILVSLIIASVSVMFLRADVRVSVFFTSLAIRIMQLRYISGDMKSCLFKWFNYMKINGGLHALKSSIGDYNVLYETVLALLTYISGSELFLIKAVSIFFDYLLAGAVGYLVFILTNNRKKAYLASFVCIMHPVVYFNSAIWGQCDSIYVFFIIVSIIFLIKNKYLYSFIYLGIAFSFKLQAVFILPFYLFYYIYKKDFSCLYFFLIPIVTFLSSIIAMIYGRGVFEFIRIYFKQVKEYPFFNVSYPGFWNYFVDSSKFYDMKYIYMASVFAVIMCALISVINFWFNRTQFDNIMLLKHAFITTYSLIYFLPCMHERYSYLVIVLALIIAVVDRNTLQKFIVLSAVDVSTYSVFLFRILYFYGGLSIINTGCFLLYIKYFFNLNKSVIKKKLNDIKI